MAGFIRIGDKSWSTANWAYWSLMDNVIDALAKEPDVARRVEGCKWMQHLSFPLLREEDPKLAEKVFIALKSVAERCASGDVVCKMDGKPLDSISQKQFRESMNDLVGILSGEGQGKRRTEYR